MSTTFHTGGDVVWSPSNQVARLFTGQAAVITSVFAVPSGLGDIIEDECEIDPSAFAAFLTAILHQYQAATHPILRSLIVGFLGTALVLADRAGLPLPEQPQDQLTAWVALREQQARYMSR
jgi:uncharacterized protein DUF6086